MKNRLHLPSEQGQQIKRRAIGPQDGSHFHNTLLSLQLTNCPTLCLPSFFPASSLLSSFFIPSVIFKSECPHNGKVHLGQKSLVVFTPSLKFFLPLSSPSSSPSLSLPLLKLHLLLHQKGVIRRSPWMKEPFTSKMQHPCILSI